MATELMMTIIWRATDAADRHRRMATCADSSSRLSRLCKWCRAPLEAVQSVAVDAVMPIFRAAVDAAEQHILRMHAQDFGRAEAPAVAGASPYMADLVRHISHCRCATAAGG